MFYRVLILEILVIIGLVYLRFAPAEPAGAMPEAVAPRSAPSTGFSQNPEDPPAPRPAAPVAPLPPGQLVFPVADHGPDDIISGFGDRRGPNRLHQGIDVKAPEGTPVVAVTDGFVERVREGGNGGKSVYLRDGRGRLYYYAHLADWSVEEFEAVEAGDVIGTVGETGNARGTTPHLHFEILLGKEREAIDPAEVF